MRVLRNPEQSPKFRGFWKRCRRALKDCNRRLKPLVLDQLQAESHPVPLLVRRQRSRCIVGLHRRYRITALFLNVADQRFTCGAFRAHLCVRKRLGRLSRLQFRHRDGQQKFRVRRRERECAFHLPNRSLRLVQAGCDRRFEPVKRDPLLEFSRFRYALKRFAGFRIAALPR